jgi:orotidine-5'-phosphate decarboxylase
MPAPTLSSPQEARLIKRFCFTDFKVLCRGVRLGQGRAVQCLAANAPALSPGCKAAMAQASR